MATNFDHYAAKGNEVLHLLADELQVPRDKAARILRAVLHALRNRLTLEESFQFLSQLPMALKGMYVDGWKPSKPFERLHHVHEFLDEIRHEDGKLSGYDFGNDQKARAALRAVFLTLSYFISDGETENVIAMMPEEIKAFLNEVIGGKRVVM